MTAEDIAKKYVYGNHDALTDNQEVIDMTKDIEEYAKHGYPVDEALKHIAGLTKMQVCLSLELPDKAYADVSKILGEVKIFLIEQIK